MAVVGAFLIGCVVLLMVVGCAGVLSEAPQKEEQEHQPPPPRLKTNVKGTRHLQ